MQRELVCAFVAGQGLKRCMLAMSVVEHEVKLTPTVVETWLAG